MAQTTSPDYVQFEQDPSLTPEEGSEGKKSFLGKLKHRTKDKKNKLKSKLRSSNTGDNEEANEESSSSSSDEESEAPVVNAVSGVTQPEHTRQTEGERVEEKPDYRGSATPAGNFPGDFAGITNERSESEGQDDTSSLSKGFQGLSTKDDSESTPDNKPVTQKVQENLSSATDAAKDKLTPSGGDSEARYTSPDAPVSEKAQQVGEQATEAGNNVGAKATEAGKSWSQWAAEKVGYAKDVTKDKAGAVKETTAANAPTTAEGKPVTEDPYGVAVESKDAALEKAGVAKDTLASKVPDRSEIPSDPSKQTYVQKATGGIYGAKDKFVTSTQPGEHDKALSQQVTETVGNLPATLKSTLGFGGKQGGASSPTTTPASLDAPVSTSSEEATGAPPQSPGIVGRITGLFGAKKPATEDSTVSES